VGKIDINQRPLMRPFSCPLILRVSPQDARVFSREKHNILCISVEVVHNMLATAIQANLAAG
jgi:hypothetical protein